MPRATGPDISFYQDDDTTAARIDFDKMKTLSDFVIIRAGQNFWVDPDFYYNWQAAKEADIPRGSYWYYDSRSRPEDQALWWFEALDNDLGELPLFADFEERYNGPYAGWVNFYHFLEALKELMPRKEIVIYTNYWYWVENVEDVAPPESVQYFKQYELWMARYSDREPWIPEPWDTWLFWQYTDHGDGLAHGVESLGIDLNYYNGTPEEFRERFNLDEPVPEPPPKTLVRINGYGTLVDGALESFRRKNPKNPQLPEEVIINGHWKVNEFGKVTSFKKKILSNPVEEVFWRVKHDQEFSRGLWRVGMPEVMLLSSRVDRYVDASPVKATKEIQEMMFELFQYGAPSLDLVSQKKKFTVVYDSGRAFMNGNGMDQYANFITGERLNRELPKFDKARVCGGATIKGTIVGDMLKVNTLRGAVPLDYLLENPHLFFRAVSSDNNISDFPQGQGEPVYIPIISREDVYYPLDKLEKVNEIADPYYVP